MVAVGCGEMELFRVVGDWMAVHKKDVATGISNSFDMV
jgi:hypothetical protein